MHTCRYLSVISDVWLSCIATTLLRLLAMEPMWPWKFPQKSMYSLRRPDMSERRPWKIFSLAKTFQSQTMNRGNSLSKYLEN